MLVRPVNERSIEARPVNVKAFSLIDCTLSGKLTDVREEMERKAPGQ